MFSEILTSRCHGLRSITDIHYINDTKRSVSSKSCFLFYGVFSVQMRFDYRTKFSGSLSSSSLINSQVFSEGL